MKPGVAARLGKPRIAVPGALGLKALGLAAFLAVAAPASRAWAQGDSATCAFYEIQAGGSASGMDPALRPLAKQLARPPWNAWSAFRSLGRHDKVVPRMKALEIKLATRGKLTLLYRDRIDARGKMPRLQLSLSLDGADGKRMMDTTLKLDSGQYALISGERLPDGATYAVAISCSVN
jgi:hypothetical protein